MPRYALPCWLAMLVALCGTSCLAQTATAYPHEQADLHALANAPDEAQLRETITTLVGFGTRHTLSDTTSPKRGIGAARRWVQSRFEAISHDCGGCLEIETPSQRVTSERIPVPADIVDVVAATAVQAGRGK